MKLQQGTEHLGYCHSHELAYLDNMCIVDLQSQAFVDTPHYSKTKQNKKKIFTSSRTAGWPSGSLTTDVYWI